MDALFIVINKTEFFEDILSILVRRNVKGATILDSQGMASVIVNDEYKSIPLFGSLKNVLKNRHPYNKTIFTVIKDREVLERVVQDIEELIKDDNDIGIGFLFTVPVGQMFHLGNGQKVISGSND